MNDNFFSKFRQSPREEFAQSLYAKLNREVQPPKPVYQKRPSRALAYVMAAFLATIILGVAVAPASARAIVEKIIATLRVKGVTVFVDDEVYVPTGDAAVESYESYGDVWTPFAPRDIALQYPYYSRIPGWVPAGFVLQERAALFFATIYSEEPSSSILVWKNKDNETIQLETTKGSCPNGEYYDPDGPLHDRRQDCTHSIYILVGPGAKIDVKTVKGQPAIVINRDAYFYDLSSSVQWNPSRWRSGKDSTTGLWMTWEVDGITYFIVTDSKTITVDDFVRIGESIP